ncbi:MAG: outer membrane protein assembly factor BamA [Acidobacteria bacterium]|nr:MAG: outer membrane protein assembly factor BamA [Acidobacteriota bacterium]
MHSATRKPGFNSCWPAWGALALVWLSVPALCQQDPAQKTVPPGNAQGKGEKPAAPTPQKPPEKPPSETPKEPEKLQLETPQAPPGEAPKPQVPGAQAPATPRPAEESRQAIIEDIIFRGNRRVPASTLRARIFSHKGDAYDESALERDFMALWNTAFLDDIRLEVTDGETGKIVTFFSIQSQYDPVVIKRAEVVMQDLLSAHGRQFATVRARTRNIPPNSVALTFIVVEGPKVKVGRIRFNGNKVLSSGALIRAMKLSRPVGVPPWFNWFHKTYDRDKVLYDLEKVRELYQEHGYFFALAKEPAVKMTDVKRRWPFFFFSWGRGKRVDLTIPVEEGDQYHLGRFVIRGNKLFKQDILAAVLQMKSGDVFNRTKVTKAVENYRKLYGQFGYINFAANPDIEPDNKKRVINLALDFEEDKQFFVHRIEFSGNTKTRDKVVRRELLVDEGSVFNTTWWDFSVLRMNQLGFFDPLKKEDYDIKQDTKEGKVDITVKLKEKGRSSIGFSGGISGLAGNFVGINYATNNFLGLGETLSVQMEVGTFQKLYSFGFTEPYLFDRPISSGFTIFKSDYRFDQLRQAAYLGGFGQSGLNALQQTPFGQFFAQNFQQNSSGFTTFLSYPLRRSFARIGLTYSFSVSSVQTFSPASQSFFNSLAFRQFQGPNQLNCIVSSQIMPTYVLEGKYFHPINHGRNVLGFHGLASTISGFGGKVPPPFSRIYMGGEYDIRGFDIYTISPIGFFPTIGQVCNRDNTGNQIWAVNAQGQQQPGVCGSYTRYPYNTIQFPGGDTELLTNFEYRVPIAGPVTLSYFVDTGTTFIWRPSQLKLQPETFKPINDLFPYFPTPDHLKPIGLTNFRPRSSTGIELQVILPVVNMPLRIFYGYNWLRLNDRILPPQAVPPLSLFPNQATYNDALKVFAPFRLPDRKTRLGFTVARTF